MARPRTSPGTSSCSGIGDTVRKSLGASNGRIAIVVSKGTLWIRNIELAKLDVQNFVVALLGKDLKKSRDIRCGVAAFTVKDGVAARRPVLFDTGRAVYTMKGQFSFKDESIGLSLRGRSKEFSLFSGQSPIGINGCFAAPKVNPISKELLARAGAERPARHRRDAGRRDPAVRRPRHARRTRTAPRSRAPRPARRSPPRRPIPRSRRRQGDKLEAEGSLGIF